MAGRSHIDPKLELEGPRVTGATYDWTREEAGRQVPSQAVENSRSHCSQNPTSERLCRARDHSSFHCLGWPQSRAQSQVTSLHSKLECGGYFPFMDGQGLLKSLRNSPEAATGRPKNLLVSYVRANSGPYSWHPTWPWEEPAAAGPYSPEPVSTDGHSTDTRGCNASPPWLSLRKKALPLRRRLARGSHLVAQHP